MIMYQPGDKVFVLHYKELVTIINKDFFNVYLVRQCEPTGIVYYVNGDDFRPPTKLERALL